MSIKTNLFGVLGVVLGLSLLPACGEDEPRAAHHSDKTASPLTTEEAAHLEAFRASKAVDAAARPAPMPSAVPTKVDPHRPAAWDLAASQAAPKTESTSSPRPTPTPERLPAPAPKPAANATSGVVAFEKHTFTEQTTGMPAFTALVPKGWTVESSIQRTPPQLAAMFSFADILITAPDGREIHFYPSMTFHYSPDINAQPFQPVYEKFFLPPPDSIGDLLLQFAKVNPDPTIKNLRIVSEEDMPALTRRLRELAAGIIQSMAQLQQSAMPGDQMFFDTKGVKVVVQYEQDGQTKEETFVTQYQTQSFSTAGTGPIVQWGIYNMRSLSGPLGTDYTRDPTLITIAQSAQITPQWAEAQHKYFVARAPRPSPTKIERPQKTPGEIYAETRQSSLDGWKSNQATSDAVASREIDMIYEETPYTDTDGSSVRLSNHWKHVVSDGQGTILMHNDSNWNINADRDWNQRDWQTLTPQN